MAGTAPFDLATSHFNNVSHEYFARGSLYDLDVPMPNREIFRQMCTKVLLHGMV